MPISYLSNQNIPFRTANRAFDFGANKTSAKLACRDPFILPLHGKYYLYKSDDKKILCLVSEDLENWSSPVTVFDPPADFHGTKDLFWAPECHYYNGKFFLFTSVYSKLYGHRVISVYAADHPFGPFCDIAGGCITPKDWDAIDGTLYMDKEGRPWMVFVHEWTSMPEGNGGMVAARLSADFTHFISEPICLFRAKDAVWATAGVTDGPYMLRTEKDLFMIWSNFCDGGYAIGLARSANGEIDGEWIQSEKPIYRKDIDKNAPYDGGHAMLFLDFSGELRIAFHSPNEHSNGNPEHLTLRRVKVDGDTISLY